jgi:hypothetical protein
MRKTELVIFSKPDDEFLTAGCSSRPDVRFKLMGEQPRTQPTLAENVRHPLPKSPRPRGREPIRNADRGRVYPRRLTLGA